MTGTGKDESGSHRLGKTSRLIGNFLLILDWKIDKVVVLCADQNGNCRLVETATLSIPLLDAVESALAREVKHEEDGDGIIANQREHIDKLALTAKVPDGKGNFGVADRNGLFHKVDAERLDVVLVPAALDVLDHERRLTDLGVADHADLDDDVIAAVGGRGFARALAAAAVVAVRAVVLRRRLVRHFTASSRPGCCRLRCAAATAVTGHRRRVPRGRRIVVVVLLLV